MCEESRKRGMKGFASMEADKDVIELGPPTHIGIVVKDLKEASAYYTSMFGIGPWTFGQNNPTKEEVLVGEPFKLDVCFTKWGPLTIELLQPVEGDSVWAKFLKTSGGGIHHVCHKVANVDQVIKQMEERGAKMTTGGIVGDDKWCYFETSPGGLIFEILSESAPL
jgi:methylmalonyl-CoA epimerase